MIPRPGLHANDPPAWTPVLRLLSDVQPEPVEWLWPDRIALGKVTVIAGDPGLGKSFITLDLAARISAGTPWPDLLDVPNPVGGVVLISAEDDLADTIRPRLDAARANPIRIVALEGARCIAAENGRPNVLPWCLEDGMVVLEQAVASLANCRLIVIDPVTAFLGEKTDSHKNSDIRRVLSPLTALAARTRVAVLCVSHFNKATQGTALYRTMGSLGFVACARAAWGVTKDSDDPARRLVLPIKNNLAQCETGLAYRIIETDIGPVVAWESDPITLDVDEALAAGRPDGRTDRSERRVAREWLKDILGNGRVEATVIKKLAKDEGHAWRTVHRAADELKVIRKRSGFGAGGTWYWLLLEHSAPQTSGIYGDSGTNGSDDTENAVFDETDRGTYDVPR